MYTAGWIEDIVVILKVRSSIYLSSLKLLNMTGYIVAGKNNGGYKYGEIAEKPPNLIIKRTKVSLQHYYYYWVVGWFTTPQLYSMVQ